MDDETKTTDSELPETAPITFVNNSSETPDWQPPKLRRRIFKYILIVVGAFILLVIGIIAFYIIQNQLGKSNQNRAYREAVARCGHDPVVVVDHHVEFGESYTTTQIYSPTNPSYQSQKAIHNSGPLEFGYDKVRGYYCSLEGARSATGNSANDSANNYTQAELDKISRSFLQTFSDIKLIVPQELKSTPSTLELVNKTIHKSDNISGDLDEPYVYTYKAKGATKDDKREVGFSCASKEYSYLLPAWLKPQNTGQVKVETIMDPRSLASNSSQATQQYTRSVYYLKGQGNQQGWLTEVWQVKNSTLNITQCALVDEFSLVPKAEGNTLMMTLQPIDLSKLYGTTIYFL